MTGLGKRDLDEARQQLAQYVVRTPTFELVTPTGVRVKCENLQVSGSFKWRGAVYGALAARRGVVGGSSGNHGIALAQAAALFGLPAVVVMTALADSSKRRVIEDLGAEVIVCNGSNRERDAHAQSVARQRKYEFVSSHDSLRVIAGHATVASELIDDGASTIVVPLGGGGLAAACGLAAFHSGRRTVRVIAVEPSGASRFLASFARGRRTTIPVDTLCDGARADTPGRLTFPIVRDYVARVVAVQDAEVLAAVELLHRAGHQVEPTAALAVAGAISFGLTDAVAVVTAGRRDQIEQFSPASPARL